MYAVTKVLETNQSELLMEEIDATDHSTHAARPPEECPTRANLRFAKSTSTPAPCPAKNTDASNMVFS